MREAELWAQLERVLGRDYARSWAQHVALSQIGSRTVSEALKCGLPNKQIWRAACEQLELPAAQR